MAIKLGELELATAGDVVVAGFAYGIGFAVDAFFFPGGAECGAVAGASAASAIGVKYAVQTLLAKRLPNAKEEAGVDTEGAADVDDE